MTPLGMLDGTKTLEEFFASIFRTVSTRSRTFGPHCPYICCWKWWYAY